MGQPIRVWAEYLYGTEHNHYQKSEVTSKKLLNGQSEIPGCYYSTERNEMFRIALLSRTEQLLNISLHENSSCLELHVE